MIEQLVEQIEARFGEVQAQMGDPAVLGDRRRMADAGREFRHLEPAAKLAEEWRRAVSDVEGVRAERFLILPHPEVLKFFQNKGSDYDRWIAGMRRVQAAAEAGA